MRLRLEFSGKFRLKTDSEFLRSRAWNFATEFKILVSVQG